MIDNYDFKYPKKTRELNDFLIKYPKTKVLITASKEIEHLILGDSCRLKFPFQKVYLNSFKTSHIRDIINRICIKNDERENEKILNRVVSGLNDCIIPRTPFMVSAAISVFKREKSFKPINKAFLVERFVEILLEKARISNNDQIDYKIKEDYLSSVVEYMVKNDSYILERDILHKETVSYLEAIGSNHSAYRLIEYFIYKRIFSVIDKTRIQFKLKSFFELFCAKKMIENKDFYTYILEEERYLHFYYEIEYYAGLKRNCLDVLQLVETRVNDIWKKVNSSIELNIFNTFKIGYSILDSMDSDQICSLMDDKNETQNLRDELMDIFSSEITEKKQKIKKDGLFKERISKYITTLNLFGNVLRLNELIKDKEKKRTIYQ